MVLTATAFYRTVTGIFSPMIFVLLKHARSFSRRIPAPVHDRWGRRILQANWVCVPGVHLGVGRRQPSTLARYRSGSAHRQHVLVYILAVVLGRSRLAATFAAALFAIHGTRRKWRSGLRADSICSPPFFVLCGLLFFIRSETEIATNRLRVCLRFAGCMVLAILTKESAYVFPFLLVLLLISEGIGHSGDLPV